MPPATSVFIAPADHRSLLSPMTPLSQAPRELTSENAREVDERSTNQRLPELPADSRPKTVLAWPTRIPIFPVSEAAKFHWAQARLIGLVASVASSRNS